MTAPSKRGPRHRVLSCQRPRRIVFDTSTQERYRGAGRRRQVDLIRPDVWPDRWWPRILSRQQCSIILVTVILFSGQWHGGAHWRRCWRQRRDSECIYLINIFFIYYKCGWSHIYGAIIQWMTVKIIKDFINEIIFFQLTLAIIARKCGPLSSYAVKHNELSSSVIPYE